MGRAAGAANVNGSLAPSRQHQQLRSEAISCWMSHRRLSERQWPRSGRGLEEKIGALCSRAKRAASAASPSAKKSVNDSIAFMSPMPGYTGYVPAIRQPFMKLPSAQDLFSVSARDFSRPPRLDQGPHFRMQKDDMTEYRAQAHRYTGRASGFLKDPAAVHEKAFRFIMHHNEYGF